ncbi:MAG: hypothetical protein EZS28_049614, partial [Streblomastix strix]
NQVEIIQATFSNISLSGIGNGITVNALLQTGSLLLINDSEFILCKGSNIYGGAINLNISFEGQVIISNSTFNQCEAQYGGGIYLSIESGGNLTIDGQCSFTECKSSDYGGGIWAQISGVNSLLTLEDGLKFENCESDGQGEGGGIYFEIYGQATSIINKVQFSYCNASSGGGVYLYGRNQVKQIFDGTKFTNCEAYYDGGG